MTRDDIIRMARQICDVTEDSKGRLEYEMDSYGLVAFANLIAAAEREACAKVCEEIEQKAINQPPMVGQGCQACAIAIRARGQE